MQALCGLQGIFDLFNCKTPGRRRPPEYGTGRRKESGRDPGRFEKGKRSPGGTAELIFLKFFAGKWLTEGKNML
mgnify:CR=1 FL=1